MHIVSPASAALEGAVLRPAAVPQHKQLPVFAPLPSACDDGRGCEPAEDDVVYPGAGSGPIVVIARPRTAAVVAPGTSRTMLPVALNATARNTVGDIRALVATQLPGSPSPAVVRLFRVQPTVTQHPDPAVASASRVDYGATLSVSNGSFGARTRASSVSSCNAGPAVSSDAPSGVAATASRVTIELRSDGDSIADVLASNDTTQSARDKITLVFDVDGRTIKTARATGTTATSLATSAASSVSSVPCRPASAFAPPVRPRGYSGVRAAMPQ